jgi:hypothetical protein
LVSCEVRTPVSFGAARLPLTLPRRPSKIQEENRSASAVITTMSRAARRSLLRRRPLSSSSFRCLSNNYQDEAFLWARENPSLARACLEVPPDEALIPPLSTSDAAFQSFEDYWTMRGWNHHVKQEEYARRLVSHVLSAPLTLMSKHDFLQQHKNICVVGARSESTLPPQYWREMLFVAASNNQTTNICLDFVGPDVLVRPEPLHLSHSSSSLQLRWLYQGYLHDYIKQNDESSLSTWDAFVLFNPGLGHPNLAKHWLPTLRLLLELKKPLLLTAHSILDAQRDQRFLLELQLQQQQSADDVAVVSYHPNPFSSRITYLDPLEPSNYSHHVQPNKYVALINYS